MFGQERSTFACLQTNGCDLQFIILFIFCQSYDISKYKPNFALTVIFPDTIRTPVSFHLSFHVERVICKKLSSDFRIQSVRQPPNEFVLAAYIRAKWLDFEQGY